MMNFHTLMKSLTYAKRGVLDVLKFEQNMRIHMFFALVACVAAAFFRFSAVEWAILLLTIGFVLVGEILNSVFERCIDVLKPRVSDNARAMKDMMAAAVFLSALTALCVGCFLFLPKIVSSVASLYFL